MARRQRDRIDPTERHPFGRRRFLQGLDEDTPLPDFHELGAQFVGNSASAVGKAVPAGTVWIPMAQRQKHWIQAVMSE